MMDVHWNTLNGMPIISINIWIFFSFFLLVIVYAMSPMESTETFSTLFNSHLSVFNLSSFSCRSAISSFSACSCCCRSSEITLPGSDSESSWEMELMGSPRFLRKQMILMRFRSSSEYSRLPPSVSSVGTRMPRVS